MVHSYNQKYCLKIKQLFHLLSIFRYSLLDRCGSLQTYCTVIYFQSLFSSLFLYHTANWLISPRWSQNRPVSPFQSSSWLLASSPSSSWRGLSWTVERWEGLWRRERPWCQTTEMGPDTVTEQVLIWRAAATTSMLTFRLTPPFVPSCSSSPSRSTRSLRVLQSACRALTQR